MWFELALALPQIIPLKIDEFRVVTLVSLVMTYLHPQDSYLNVNLIPTITVFVRMT